MSNIPSIQRDYPAADPARVVETLVSDVKVGDLRQYNNGTSIITAIVPEGRVWVRVHYRSTHRQATPRPNGSYYNTVGMRARRDSYLPLVTDPATFTAEEVTALVEWIREAIAPTTFCAARSLTMAERDLALYRKPARHWTAEMRRITLRDAGNSARLAVRYYTEGV